MTPSNFIDPPEKDPSRSNIFMDAITNIEDWYKETYGSTMEEFNKKRRERQAAQQSKTGIDYIGKSAKRAWEGITEFPKNIEGFIGGSYLARQTPDSRDTGFDNFLFQSAEGADWMNLGVPKELQYKIYREYKRLRTRGLNHFEAITDAYKMYRSELPRSARWPLAGFGEAATAFMPLGWVGKGAKGASVAAKGAKAVKGAGQLAEKAAPTVKAAKAKPRLLEDLNPEELVEEVVSGTTRGGKRRGWYNWPVIRHAQKVFNPSALSATVHADLGFAGPRLLASGNTKAVGAFAGLRQLGSAKEVFNLTEKGFIQARQVKQQWKNIPEGLVGKHIDDVLERSRKLQKEGGFKDILTDSQKQWAEMYHDLNKAKLDLFERNGIHVPKLFLDGGEYVGRVVVGKVGKEADQLDFMARKITKGTGQLKQRTEKDITAAIAEGYRYLFPDEALLHNIQGAYRVVAEKTLQDYAFTSGKVLFRDARNVEQALNVVGKLMALKLATKISIPKNLQSGFRAIEKNYPDIGRKLKAILAKPDAETRYTQLAKIRKSLSDILPASEAKAYWRTQGLNEALIASDKAINVIEAAISGNKVSTGYLSSAFVDVIARASAQLSTRALGSARGLGKTKTILNDIVAIGTETAEQAKLFPVQKAIDPRAAGLGMELQKVLALLRGAKPRKVRKLTPTEDITTLTYSRGIRGELNKLGKKAKIELEKLSKQRMKVRDGEARLERAGKILIGPNAAENAKALNFALSREYGNALTNIVTKANKISSIGRFMVLTGDMSPALIQLITMPFINPVGFARTMKGGVKAMLNPKTHDAYLWSNNAYIQRQTNIILSKSHPLEMTEGFRKGGLLSAEGPWKTQFLGKTVGRAMKPFQRYYEATLDIAGIELKKGLEHIPKNAQEMLQLDQFINVVRGLTSSTRLGVAPSVQAAESLVLLAPRYNRAIAALMTDVLRGGLRGKMARMAIMRVTAGYALIGTAITLAKGEGWEGVTRHLDIRSPDFVTWEFAEQRLGPGSKIRSVLALTGKMAHEPEKSVDHVLRWARGNLSPLLKTSIDVGSGKDFLGNPTLPGADVGYSEGFLGLGKAVLAQNLMPIWLQSAIIDSGDLGQRATRGTAEFLGMRAYEPSSVSSVYRFRWRDDLDEYNEIPTSEAERAMEGVEISRDQYRARNPEIDAKLFIAGQVSSLKGRRAIGEVLRLIKENKIVPNQIVGVAEGRAKIREAEEAKLPIKTTPLNDLLWELAKLHTFDDPTAFDRRASK